MLNKAMNNRFVIASLITLVLFCFQNCGTQFKIADERLLSSSDATFFSVPTIVFAQTPDFLNTAVSTLTFDVNLSGSAAIKKITCQLGTGAEADCLTKTISYNNLIDGDYSLKVTVETTAGVKSDAIKVFRKDVTLPTLAVASTPASITNQTTANFTFTANDNLSGIAKSECSLDNAAFATCTSPVALQGLLAGAHNFRIKSTDRASNESLIYAYNWTIDLNVPTVVISQNPTAVTNLTTANFVFAGAGIVTYECQLDAAAFAACVSPVALNNLAAGNHVFRIRGTNAAGTTSAVIQYTWMIDNVAPTIPVINANVLAQTLLSSITATFASTDTGGSGVAAYNCSVDGVAFAVCTSPLTLNNLVDGLHSIRVRAVDNAGNVSGIAVFSWVIDKVPPVITISQAPPATTGSPNANFVFSISDNNMLLPNAMCSLDNAAFAACTSPRSYTNLNVGNHNLRIQANDVVGNIALVQHNWTITPTFSPSFTTVPQGLPTYTARAGYGQRVFIEGANVYVPTDGGLSISRNGGSTYTTRTTVNGLGSNNVSHVVASGNTIYAATYGGSGYDFGSISISRDGGNTFTNTSIISSGLQGYTITGLQVVGTVIYATTNRSTLAVSTDGGLTFVHRNVTQGRLNDFIAIGTAFYIATDDGVAISTDSGNTFAFRTTANGLPNNQVTNIAVTNNAIYAVVQGSNLLFKSVDNGNTFSPITVVPQGILYSVGAENNLVVVQAQAGTYVSTNAAANFTVRNQMYQYRDGKPFVTGTSIYIPLSTGELVGSTDSGVNFAQLGQNHAFGYASNYNLSLSSSGGRLYLGGNVGVYYSTDLGASFTALPVQAVSYANVFADGTSIYAGGVGTFLYVSHDNGASFTRKIDTDGIQNSYINGIFASGNNVYVATSGGVSVSTNGGTSFITRTTANGLGSNEVSDVTVANNVVYASTGAGLSISTDGGNTYVTRSAAHGLGELGQVQVAQTQVVGTTIYSMISSGRLYKSVDNGATFTMLAGSPGGGRKFLVDGSNIFVGTYSDGLYVSSDGGNYFIKRTNENGLGSNSIGCLHKFQNKVFACTPYGLAREN